MCLWNIIQNKRLHVYKLNHPERVSNEQIFETVDVENIRTKSEMARSVRVRQAAYARQNSERLIN